MASPCVSCSIRETSVCGALAPDELERFSSIVMAQTFDQGETIFYEGDPATSLYNVTSGCVRLSKLLPDGRRQVTGFLFAGDFLGLAYVDSYAFTAEAITEVRLCLFPRGRFQALLDDFPALEKRLLGMASNELAAAQDQIVLLGRKSAKEKLATFLLNLSKRQSATLNGAPVQLPMTRNDIADCVGLTTETVSRTFTKLTDEGLISLKTPHEVVLDGLDDMKDLAGDYY